MFSCILLFAALIGARCVDVHVSPGGSDAGSGTVSDPFQTLTHALEFLREKRAGRPLTEVDRATVWLHGRNLLQERLTLLRADSFVTLAGWPTDQPTETPGISGGRQLRGSWARPASSSPAWRLRLDDAAPFRQLFVNGTRAQRAREPELGSFFVMQEQLAAPLKGQGFYANSSDVAELRRSPDLLLGEVVVYSSWMAARRQVQSVGQDSAVVLTHPARIEIDPYENSGARYYIENYREACDSPGEFFLDSNASELLWVPRSVDEDPRTLVFEAPSFAGHLLLLNDTQSVRLENLTMEMVDWGDDATYTQSGTVQAASFLQSAALHTVGASASVFRGLEIRHVGGHGVWVDNGSKGTLIDSCLISDLGGGGVRVGRGNPLPEPALDSSERASATTIRDCTIVVGSQVYHEGNGILIQHSSDNLVENNEVAYFNHAGISTGWTWDYLAPSGAVRNVIRRNLVHHMGNGDLSDLAGIYFLGISDGTSCEDNVVHSIVPYYQYGHGIYTDQASSNIMVHRNLVYNTEAAGCYQHFGRNVTFSNNIFALARNGGELWHANFQFEQFGSSDLKFDHNIVYTSSSVFQSPFNGSWTGDRNVFFNSSGAPLSATFPKSDWQSCRHHGVDCAADNSLEGWQSSSGNDLHSIVQDPEFADAEHFNFTLRSSSPALALGIQPLNPSQSGPRQGAKKQDWRRSLLNCDAASSCSPPDALQNGYLSFTGNSCGDVALTRCNEGFVLHGSTYRYCSEAGWGGSTPECVKVPSVGPRDSLSSPGKLSAGEYLVAADESAFLIMQEGGNLCLYKGTGPSHNLGNLWCSGTGGTGNSEALVQGDGNLCVYPGGSPPASFCSRSAGKSADYFLWVRNGAAEMHRGVGPSQDAGKIWSQPGQLLV